MAMFYYRSSNDKNLEGNRNGWSAKIEVVKAQENKLDIPRLVIIHKKDESNEIEKYIVSEFHDMSGKFKDCTDVYYSFDYKTYNFHIVPSCSDGKNVYIQQCDALFKAVNDKLKENKYSLNMRSGQHMPNHTKYHRYKYMNYGEYQYMISFNRLYCDNFNHIHNNFGQIQFLHYPIQDMHINKFIVGEKELYEMVYPRTGTDGDMGKCIKGHCIYNPADLTIRSSAEDIADTFIDFVKRSRKI